MISDRAKDATKDLIFVSRPIKCSCNNVVLCFKESPVGTWECPICETHFPGDFQKPLDPRDPYDFQMGRDFGFEPEMLGGRWSVENADDLLRMIGPIRR